MITRVNHRDSLKKIPCIVSVYRFVRARIRNVKLDMIPWLEFHLYRLLKKSGICAYDPVIKELQNKYSGKNRRIFIVATGPSIRVSDLDWLKRNNELSISVNTIYKIFGETEWRPTYYCILDYNAAKNAMDAGVRLEDCCTSKVVIDRRTSRKLKYKYNREKIGIVECNFLDHWSRGVNSKKWGYSSDLLNYGVIDCCTVVNGVIALADFMGIKDIFLLGVDGCLTGRKAHVGETEWEGKQYESAKNNTNGVSKSFYIMRDLISDRGIRVYNATRGGIVEAFERVDMDTIIAKGKK